MNAITRAEAGDALAKVLRYEPSTGEFIWTCSRRGGAKAGNRAGAIRKDGYVQINFLGHFFYAHRIAWFFSTGSWPDQFIDHIDGNPSNNRLINLRHATPLINQQNQRRAHASNKSSGLQGVTYDKRSGKWMAKISLSNKSKCIGRFDTAGLAHQAYLLTKRNLHDGATV